MADVKYDMLWKEITAALFEDFVHFFVPDLFEKIDFSKDTEFLEQELHQLFPDAEDGKRYTDKLAKVYLKNGDEQWILIHVEIQGDRDNTFAERMFRYFYRVFDKYHRKIYAISIFTDEQKYFKPSQYNYQFFGTELTYKYNTYKIRDQNEQDLMTSENPFALVILAGLYVIKGKQHHEQKYAFKKRLIQLLLQKHWSREHMNQLFVFIDAIIQLPNTENAMFIEDIRPLIEKGSERMGLSLDQTSFAEHYRRKGMEKGIEEGIEKGIEKEKYNIALKMVKEELPPKLISEITELSLEQIEQIRKQQTN